MGTFLEPGLRGSTLELGLHACGQLPSLEPQGSLKPSSFPSVQMEKMEPWREGFHPALLGSQLKRRRKTSESEGRVTMSQKVGERRPHSLHAVQGQEWISGLQMQRGRLKITSSRKPTLHGFCSFPAIFSPVCLRHVNQ